MKKIISKLSAILISFIIIFSGGLLVLSLESHGGQNDKGKGIQPLRFIGEYSIDGKEYQELTPNTDIDIKKNQTIVLVGRFDRNIDNEEILFTIKNFKFSMKVNGTCVKEYGHNGTYPDFFKSAGFARVMYSADSITPEDKIEIELTYPYKRGGRTAIYEFINKISVGEKADFYASYVTNHGASFLLTTTIILIGLLLFAASITLGGWKNKSGVRLLSFSIFVISGGIWFFMDTFYTSANVIMPFALALNIVDMINMLLLPICASCFISAFFENTKTIKVADIIKLLQLICICLIIMLQFCGIKDIYENQVVSIPINGTACLVIIITAFYEAIKDKNKRIQSALIAVFPTAIGVYSDIAIHYSNPRNYKYLFRSGFLISCCIHLFTSSKLFKENVEVMAREEKLKNQMTSLKVSIMLSQIQPHFLYNALNAIQYICMEDADKAVKAIEHFSKYLRGNMDSLKQRDLIPFEKELSHLNNYLYIEYLRFGDRVKVEYDLEITDFLMPCLIIQPIVENSIRYGITRKVEGGTVNISTREDDKNIIISIADDGIGFDPRQTQYDKRSHIGIDNVKERLRLQCDGSLHIESVTNVGTTMTIHIPKEGVLML